MRLRPLAWIPLVFVAACALNETPPDESTTDQDLTANEVDSSWFSDAAFTNQVGESDLYCSGGKYQTGTINTKYVARFTWPCNGAGGHKVYCYQYVLSTDGWKYQNVACPAWLF